VCIDQYRECGYPYSNDCWKTKQKVYLWNRWNSLFGWFSDWAVDIHPDVYLRSLEITDATAALLTKERMNMTLFDCPTILHVPVSHYSDHKRR